MIFKTKIKLLIVTISFFVLSFVFSDATYSSDYQYKILDPKYNPNLEQIVKDNYNQANNNTTINPNKGFDFGRFLAILVSISFPFLIISLVMKSFKRITEDVVGRSNIDVVDEVIIKNITETDAENLIDSSEDEVEVETEIELSADAELEDNSDNGLVVNDVVHSNMTMPSSFSSSDVFNKTIIAENKGLGFVEKNQKSTLVGFINEKVFELNDFSEYKANEIRAKLLETVGAKDRYIVRMEKYKALVEVSDEKIDLILEL